MERSTRTEKLANMGMTRKDARQNEILTENPEIVEKYIERTIEQDEAPTT